VCEYCRGKLFDIPQPEYCDESIDELIPCDMSVDLEKLYQFFAKDPDAVVTFIGENQHYGQILSRIL
jgi:hypothetical protein